MSWFNPYKRFRFGGTNFRWSNWGLHLDMDLGISESPTPFQATRDWVVFILGSVLCGLAMLVIEPWLLSAKGGFGPTILQAAHPVAAGVALLMALIVCVFIGATAGRILKSPNKGLVVIGIGIGWLAWRLQGIETIAYNGTLKPVAIETLVWSVLMFGITILVYMVAGPLRYVQSRESKVGTNPLGEINWDHWASSPAAAKLMAAGLCAIPVAGFFAASPMRGQAVAAVTMAGVVVGLVGRLVAPHIQPVLLTTAMMLAGALTQWGISFMVPADELPVIFAQGQLPHLLYPMPIDWAAGALMGVPWGLYAGNAFLHHEDDDGQVAQAA